MDAQTFLNHLRGALHATWEDAAVRPKLPSEYSAYIFTALAGAASFAGMDYRGHGHGRELLYDGVWLPQNDGSYRLPHVLIEHENGTTPEHFIYDMRKLMMAWAPLRVMIGYVPVGHDPHERIETIRIAAETGRWVYPNDCEDLVLVGPYWMHSPRDYLVLHRPAGSSEFVEWGDLDSAITSIIPT